MEQLHSYVNHELNRFLKIEKPKTVYIVKLPRSCAGGVNKKINNSVALWQRGYIRERLQLKCKEQSVEFVEVLGKGISTECSRCGAIGVTKNGMFACPGCNYTIEEKTNTSQNVLKRGKDGKVLNKS
ncbi:zinc ribbon domain-containing protein [Sporofaciens musculi]|uniref:zinc ribbon domain-containing protein n=1 Tax=Sporofaciens musculi TaxID=2681861 RepID=UPI0025A0C9BD|nr:zinc ribbon domain-containing protein [Sporofaciens musculi]